MNETRRLAIGLAVIVGVCVTPTETFAAPHPASAAAAQDTTVRVLRSAVIVAEPRGVGIHLWPHTSTTAGAKCNALWTARRLCP